ncbi:MAG TPA: outer membrane beta-barrel protein [Saprospiraceae bacterium]|nr:outer membrane beta-barrel protein [Saprospiraceae bacterium]
MHHLQGRKIILLLAFTLLALSQAWSQRPKGNFNYLDFQNKPYYFGITLGYNQSSFRVYNSDDFILNDSIRVLNAVNGPGLNLGIITNLKIGEYFDFRFIPSFSFAERNLQYTSTQEDRMDEIRTIESVFLEMPFILRYKSAPFNDIRIYALTGFKYTFDVASNSRTRQAESLVKISPTDYALEFGVGIQMFFPYFIFSPEIKISQGISNSLIYDDDLLQSRVIDQILSRTFTLSFHFEG